MSLTLLADSSPINSKRGIQGSLDILAPLEGSCAAERGLWERYEALEDRCVEEREMLTDVRAPTV